MVIFEVFHDLLSRRPKKLWWNPIISQLTQVTKQIAQNIIASIFDGLAYLRLCIVLQSGLAKRTPLIHKHTKLINILINLQAILIRTEIEAISRAVV